MSAIIYHQLPNFLYLAILFRVMEIFNLNRASILQYFILENVRNSRKFKEKDRKSDDRPAERTENASAVIGEGHSCVCCIIKIPKGRCGHFLGPFILQYPPPIMQLTVPNSVGIESDSFLRVRV